MFRKKSNWEEDESTNLTERDRRDLRYDIFLACLMAITVSVLVFAFFTARNYRKEAEDVEEVLESIYAYMATATEEEYDSIARQIRNDLVIRNYDQEQIELASHIPNTSSKCCIEAFTGYDKPLMFSTNNGNVYTLELEDGIDTDSTNYSFSYDEISETTISIETGSHVTANITSRKGIVSVQRMKKLFCDDCIEKILTANQNSMVPELIIYDAQNKEFFPIESGEEYTIGTYKLSVKYTDWSEYQILITQN